MRTSKNARTLATMIFLGVLLTPLSAIVWDNLTVFGDSLSDGGNILAVIPGIAIVTAGLKSTRTAFSSTTGARDNNWLDVAVGANVPLGERVNAFAGVSAVGGNIDAHQLSWNVSVNATF